MRQSDHTYATGAPDKVGYVVKVYPRFSETFVVTEILARERAGEQLTVFAMRPTTDARFHPELAQVQAPVRHVPKPVKLTDAWGLTAQAQGALPGFAERYAALLPVLVQLDASDVVQGIDLALRVQAEGITHLHAHFASLAARVAMVAAGLAGITYSVTTHAKDLFHESVDPALLAQVLQRADHVVAISEYNRRYLAERFSQVDPHTVLVRNGIDLQKFSYRDPARVGSVLRVLAVGRLVEKKGFGDLISAAAAAREAGLDLEVRIAGDGELREELAQAILDDDLADQIHLLGPRSQAEVRELLEWADVFVAPCVVGADGNADGLPTVLLEAMATGVPCVATSVTGIPEAVTDETGILLPPGDVAGLTDALHRVAEPGYPRVAVARAARALIESEYDTQVQSARLRSHQHGGGPASTEEVA